VGLFRDHRTRLAPTLAGRQTGEFLKVGIIGRTRKATKDMNCWRIAGNSEVTPFWSYFLVGGYSVETKKKYARLAGVSFSNSRNP
jgi:hypothetical protein